VPITSSHQSGLMHSKRNAHAMPLWPSLDSFKPHHQRRHRRGLGGALRHTAEQRARGGAQSERGGPTPADAQPSSCKRLRKEAITAS